MRFTMRVPCTKTQSCNKHFRVLLCLCFKASPSARPFLWNWLWFAWKWNCMQNSFSIWKVSHLDSCQAQTQATQPGLQCTNHKGFMLYIHITPYALISRQWFFPLFFLYCTSILSHYSLSFYFNSLAIISFQVQLILQQRRKVKRGRELMV